MIKNRINFHFFVPLAAILCAFLSCSKNDPPSENELEQKPEEIIEKVPELETREIIDISTNSANAGGNITDKGSSKVQQRGLCWSKTPNPTLKNSYSEASSVHASGEFSAQINDLEEGTLYYTRAFATNSEGTGYGNELNFSTRKATKPIQPTVYLDSTSFESKTKFEKNWNMLYPWGEDHNGAARMHEDQVKLEENGTLLLSSDRIYPEWEGYSTADPHLRIKYHSGAIHFKENIKVTAELPYWEISGDFKAPTMKGSWPAFWLSGAWNWPPEIDILEFKGSTSNWQNTVTGPSWDQTIWTSDKTVIEDADEQWHNYKVSLQKVSDSDVQVSLFIDNEQKATYRKDYVGDPFWLIINLQMEGASGEPGPEHAEFRARNIYIAATPSA